MESTIMDTCFQHSVGGFSQYQLALLHCMYVACLMDIRPDVQYTPSDCLKTELEDVWCSLINYTLYMHCLLYTSPSPRDATLSRMPSSA